ncbi:MAG: DNA polymerase I [Muribaculaceae bacterium]|nr:DNA polymerase I [Muribaculaceae bacterium]
MEEKRLFLIDAYAFIYRAYYALIRAPRINSKGFNTSAIFGFCNSLDEILRKERPTHIAVCFDPEGGHTFRHEAYPEYKAQREAQPEDITRSIPYIKDIISAHNIPIVEVPGYEADDVIGTLARRAAAEGYTTFMMTPDKDYAQLVTDNTFMCRPSVKGGGFEVRGVAQVCERYGLSRPSQVIDMLALEGDVSDNIPGCPGVGEKTAVKLIAEWGSVENLLANTSSLKGALQKKIVENAEKITFSKFLVTIKTDVPVDCTIDSLVRREDNVGQLAKIYTELEFKSFLSKLEQPGNADMQSGVSSVTGDTMPSLFDMPEEVVPTVAEEASFSESSQLYTEVSDVARIEEIVSEAVAVPAVGVSVYAVGNDAMTARLSGLALALSAGKAYYFPLPADLTERERFIAVFRKLFSCQGATIVSHDVKRDYIVLKNEGIVLSAPYYDTSVAHYLLQPEMRHGLPGVAFTFLHYRTLDYAAGAKSVNRTVEYYGRDALLHACEAADVSLRLYPVLVKQLEDNGLSSLMTDIELPFIRVLAEMELTGVRIDAGELSGLSRGFTTRLHEMEREVYALAGGEFNVASPMQVGEVLFGRMKIDPKARRTAKGSYSTTEEVLEKYRNAHPIVGLILEIRGLRKLLTTYVNALPELVNVKTGKIHTSYNQTVTATGRLSSSNPNLQNIPIRTDDGREIRRAFIADPGCVLLSADYSQIELRVIADLSGDRNMIEAFLSGADIHQATAARIYNEPLEKVTADQRRKAKTANFGIIYGISAFGLSERLGIQRAESKMLIEGYFESYPQVREYMDRCIEDARDKGYVMTIKGRKRMLPDINSRNAVVRGYAERNAINAPVQGSAADIIKIAMIDIFREFEAKGIQSSMIMQVHDELVFNVLPSELDAVKEIVSRNMENAYHGRVPLVVSSGTGSNWLEAH